MTKTCRFATAALCGIVIFQSGCLLSHSNHRVLRQGEALLPLSFESPEAQAKFEAIAANELSSECNESSSSFAIPFIIGLSSSTTVAKNAIRNDVATRIDSNSDGHISDYEVLHH